MHFRLCAVLLLGLACAPAGAGPAQEAGLGQLPNVAFPAPGRIASGRLAAADMPALREAGVREVIDLSADEETPHFDEAAAVRAAGIDYRNLPIRGAGDLTPENVRRFDALLRAAGNSRTLVHCASGNRVGAMIALRAALVDRRPVEAALAEGRRWGLRGLEPAVRERLAAWAGATATP